LFYSLPLFLSVRPVPTSTLPFVAFIETYSFPSNPKKF
jgi:hypothetical protein